MKMKTFLMALVAAAAWSLIAAENFASKSRWIWYEASQITAGDCYYRLTVDFKDRVESLELITYLDDSGHCFLNGKRIGGADHDAVGHRQGPRGGLRAAGHFDGGASALPFSPRL